MGAHLIFKFEPSSWNYAWRSNKHRQNMLHVCRTYVFRITERELNVDLKQDPDFSSHASSSSTAGVTKVEYITWGDTESFTVSGSKVADASRNATFQDRLNRSRFIVAQDSVGQVNRQRFRTHGMMVANSSSNSDGSSDERSSSSDSDGDMSLMNYSDGNSDGAKTDHEGGFANNDSNPSAGNTSDSANASDSANSDDGGRHSSLLMSSSSSSSSSSPSSSSHKKQKVVASLPITAVGSTHGASGASGASDSGAKGSNICQHGRRRYTCKKCGGKGICSHGRQRYQCKDCGGGGICRHARIRSQCKDCGGGSICKHKRIRSVCKDCGGGSICRHKRIRSKCKECRGISDSVSTSDSEASFGSSSNTSFSSSSSSSTSKKGKSQTLSQFDRYLVKGTSSGDDSNDSNGTNSASSYSSSSQQPKKKRQRTSSTSGTASTTSSSGDDSIVINQTNLLPIVIQTTTRTGGRSNRTTNDNKKSSISKPKKKNIKRVVPTHLPLPTVPSFKTADIRRAVSKNHLQIRTLTTAGPSYVRNNKRGGLKNLRCFPRCLDKGHNRNGFCGRPLNVELQISAREFRKSQFVAYGRFTLADPTGQGSHNGSIISQFQTYKSLDIMNMTKTKHDNSMPLYKGTPSTNTTGKSHGAIVFRFNPTSWHYGWRSSKHMKDSPHVFRVFCFILSPDRKLLKCVAVTETSWFTLASSKRAKSTKDELAKQLAKKQALLSSSVVPGVSSLSDSNAIHSGLDLGASFTFENDSMSLLTKLSRQPNYKQTDGDRHVQHPRTHLQSGVSFDGSFLQQDVMSQPNIQGLQSLHSLQSLESLDSLDIHDLSGDTSSSWKISNGNGDTAKNIKKKNNLNKINKARNLVLGLPISPLQQEQEQQAQQIAATYAIADLKEFGLKQLLPHMSSSSSL